MKGMKGKLLKKLKTVRSIGYLRPDRVLHVNASDGFVDTLPAKSDVKVHAQLVFREEDPKKMIQSSVKVHEPEIIDVSELMRDLENEEMEFDNDIDDKENIRPQTNEKTPVDLKNDSKISSSLKTQNGNSDTPLSEIDISSFRRPDLNSSGSLFDPNLLAAFEKAVTELRVLEAERRAKIEESIFENIEEEPPLKARKTEDNTNPLSDFEEKCPPGGDDSVILYTTGLRGIRKTFEDCNSIRFLLESFRVLFFERDVSMHSEFREELWRTLGEKVVPPKLFIKGRYIGGAEEVLTLHEQGKLRPLFDGVPIDRSEGRCEGCAGIRFVVCFNCNGSHKIITNDDGLSIQCPECNENGLIICPICC
uniref:Glutaredoxin domain-containing protein n=1 Tax=Davidia involucrata TaxID=16924 RepID=A0A5B7BEG6_DAVIN